MYMCASLCVYICVFRGKKRALDHLALELQAVGSLQVWVLGTEYGSSGREANVLHLQSISPIPTFYSFQRLYSAF